MKIHKQLALTLIIQAIGSSSTLLATLWIGITAGPQQQGHFNQLKSLIDLSIALAAMGMPQALYIYTQSNQLSLYKAKKISLWIGALGLLTGSATAFWSNGYNPTLIVIFGATSIAGCLHAQWRALLLLSQKNLTFNLTTIAPQVLLIPIAIWISIFNEASSTAISFGIFIAWAIGAAFAEMLLSKLPNQQQSDKEKSTLHSLLLHGFSTGITVALAILGTVLVQKAAQQSAGQAGLGVFSIALLLAQIPLTPLNYALPPLLKIRLAQRVTNPFDNVFFFATALLISILAIAVLFLGSIRSDLWMGSAYSGVHNILAILLTAGIAETSIRLGSVNAHATLRPWITVVAEAMRIITLLTLWFSTLDQQNPHTLPQLATGWLLAAIVSLVTLKLCNHYRRGEAPHDTPAQRL